MHTRKNQITIRLFHVWKIYGKTKENMSKKIPPLKQKTIDILQQILEQTRLSPRAGKYEAMQNMDWFMRIGRPKIEALLKELQQ